MSKKIADGFGDLGDLDEYYSFVQNGKVTLVGRKYIDQPNYHWGHRVAFVGTYVLVFDKETNQWEKNEFPELSSKENLEEILFVRNGKLHLLTYTSFGTIFFDKLFRWENNAFNEITLKAPEAKTLSENQKVDVLSASGITTSGSTIILVKDDENAIQLYSLSIDGNYASIEITSSISSEKNPLRGVPTLAETVGEKVLISYGVHGCGFHWERSRFFIFNLASKIVHSVYIEGEYNEHPEFGFRGPSVSHVNRDTRSWIVASGSVQQGMTGSKFCGSVWALKGNVFDENSQASWVKLPQTIEQGEHVFDGNTLYTITKEAIFEIQLDEI